MSAENTGRCWCGESLTAQTARIAELERQIDPAAGKIEEQRISSPVCFLIINYRGNWREAKP
jgi:hypothetical protein